VHHVVAETDLPSETHSLRATGEQRLGADVDDDAPDLLEPQLAADAVAALEHHDRLLRVATADLPRGGEPGDAAADHDDGACGGVHPSITPEPHQRERAGAPLRRRDETARSETVMTTARLTSRAALAAAALLLGLTACSSGGTDDAGGSAAEPAAADDVDAGGAVDGVATTGEAEDAVSRTVPRAAFLGRDVIATAQVRVRTEDVGRARESVRDLLTRYVGYVADERTERDRDGETVTSVLRLRVPTPKFDEALAELEELAPAVDVDRSTEDVTQQVVDVASRIRTEEISLGRLRGFLGRATAIDDVVRLEAEIARREGDLGSLRAQQRELRDLTSESTITVRLDRVSAEDEPEPDETGFAAGLSTGWDAFTATVAGLSQAAGVVLPFAVVLTLVGAPLMVWLRRRRGAAPVESPSAG
jgi:hypothetical protein